MERRPLFPANPAARVLLLLSLLTCAGCAYALVRGSEVNRKKAARIVAGIQEIRSLSFTKTVPLVVKTPDEVEQMVIKDLERDYSDEQMEADGKAGAMLGFYPPAINLKAETVKLLKSQIAGFYDPHEKQMVLVEGAYRLGFWDRTLQFVLQRDLVGEMLLAHELTHALQDQNFELQQKLDNLKDNSDRELALKSVAEGDAMLAGFAYIMGRMDNSIADDLTAHLHGLPQQFADEARDTPPGLAIPLIFQYSEGVRFVARAYQRGGWAAVDRLYAEPPLSTQQISEPELYFDRPTVPRQVTLAGYQSVLGKWENVDEDTYGELSLQIILELALGQNAPEAMLARKWAGDRMVILGKGPNVSAVWVIVFRDTDSAAKFATVYRSILDKLAQSDQHVIQLKDDAVMIVAGSAALDFDRLGPAVWKATRIAPAAAVAGTITDRAPRKASNEALSRRERGRGAAVAQFRNRCDTGVKACVATQMY